MSVFFIDTIIEHRSEFDAVWIILTRNYLMDNILEEVMTQKHTHSSWEPTIHNYVRKKRTQDPIPRPY